MGASDDDQVVTKGEFARLCNVSPGRVSQWIDQAKIGPEALVGQGRSAKIRVGVAQAQLKRHLDPNQMTANGSKTQVNASSIAVETAAPAAASALVEPPPKPRRAQPPPSDEGDPEPPGYTGTLNLTDERARLAKEQADHAALKNAALRKELIEATLAERRWAEEMALLRARMLATITDIAQALPQLTKHDIGIVDRVIRDAMTEASGVRHDGS